jgi:hypothetical protein
MKLFSRKGQAVKNWHGRTMIIDPKRTRLTLISTNETKSVPPWVYKKYAPQLMATI